MAAPRPGEWYVDPDVPPSPLAGELAGMAWLGLPPVTDVRPLSAGLLLLTLGILIAPLFRRMNAWRIRAIE